MYRKVIHIALKAWGVGLLTASVVLSATVALRAISFETILHELGPRAVAFAAMIPSSMLMVFTFGVALSLPLFAIALMTALLFRPQIERYSNLFIALAPVATAVLTAAANVALNDNPRARSDGVLERFTNSLLSWDQVIFVLPALAAALYYCRRVKTPAADGG